MRTVKVVKESDVLKDQRRILRGLEDRVKGMVVDVLKGIETNLSSELHGIALEAMKAVMEFEILDLAGPKGKHITDRRYGRGGHNPGSVVIDGVRAKCVVPRVVAIESQKSQTLQSYTFFHKAGEAVSKAYRALIHGISTRNFAEGVSGLIEGSGLSAATMSRRMIAATTKKVEELFSRSLANFALAVLMIDGIVVGEHTVIVALGIDRQGVKRILGLREAAAEKAEVVQGLLDELVERGLPTDQPILVVIDGGKGLRKAVTDVLGAHTPVQRCTVHKRRNVLAHLPKEDHSWVSRRMSQAYDLDDTEKAEVMLRTLADQLQRPHPAAARSLLEGLEDTLTVQRLHLPIQLRRSLRSTNIIESTNNGVRRHSRNVTRWRSGNQAERWVGASLLEVEKKFRRIKGCKHMQLLIAAVDDYKKRDAEAA